MFDDPLTHYAPARRSPIDVIALQRQLLSQHYDSLKRLYDALSEMILIVNQDRQIVFFNATISYALGCEDPEVVYGLRPGEAFRCTSACVHPGGCGTSEYCTQCGAVQAILSGLTNRNDLKECTLIQENSLEALELLVRTTPLEIGGQMFCIMAIQDISHEKRRRELEHTFFHDILNTAASNKLMAEMINKHPESKNAALFRENLLKGTCRLIDEILSQKQLLAAETRDLEMEWSLVDGVALVSELVEDFRSRFSGQEINIAVSDGGISLCTDRGLLQRVLENMILNAIEACEPGEAVTITCTAHDGLADFQVYNPGFMADDVRLRVFQRSFSTKGPGRGLGTYSMKLLTEGYLNGSIHVASTSSLGTTFTARFPLAQGASV